MATIRLRFSGRFVLAEPVANGKGKGELNALALKMRSDNKQNRHRSVMTIARSNLPDKMPRNFLAPFLSIVGPTKDEVIEHLVWDLAGWNVTTSNAAGGFSWSGAAEPNLPDLVKIEQARRKTVAFQPSHVRSRTAAVSSMIRVTAGSGTAPISQKEYNFAPKNNTKRKVLKADQRFADFVDVEIATSALRLEMVSRANPRVRKVVEIAVPLTDTREEAVVRFSNLCPTCYAGSDDPEFTEYYGLFKHDVKSQELLIAKETPGLGGPGSSCFLMVHATYK